MNFKKEILVPFRKLLVPFRTTVPRTVILAGHFYWFGRFVPSTETMTWTLDSFVGTLCISYDGPVAKYLLVMHGA
jgi:hypothetical protein